MSIKIDASRLKINNLEFVKAVAKYFMDFLETDFHKRRTPKRVVKLHNHDNLLVGTNLAKYPAFNQRLWKILLKGFEKDVAIEKGAYMAKIPTNLLDVIELQVGRIESKQLQSIIKTMSRAIEDAVVLHKKDYDQALAAALDGCTQKLKEGLVLPFVGGLAKPLENQGLADENIIYLMEEELTDVLLNLFENKVSSVLKNLHAGEKVNISNELKSVFSLTDVQDQTLAFFESLKVTDLFSDIYELHKNLRILDKQEFYLYFGDISCNRAKYPIFYIPLSFEQAGASFNLVFDAQVYVNKKALEYIAQEHNQETGKKGRLSAAADRIFYLANGRDTFAEFMSDVFVDLTNFFGLSTQIDLSDPSPQSARSLYVNITNSTYITLFDKSDEALINDYEDILQLLESDEDSDVAKAFDQLINDFVHNEPASFNPEIEDEWDALDTEDKLVFESPCPLNGEQLQILSAIRRKGCRYITVEGPPGTGKSHTITAVVFDAILKDQSVLVLSDKKEALDVVEDKITESINDVRHDKDFQNPILRLGKTGNTYSQILATAALDNIKSHYRAVKQRYADLEEGINKTANSLKENLEAEIVGYSEIELKEVDELVLLESALGQADDVIDVDEAVQQTQSVIELEEIRQICLRLKEFGSTKGTAAMLKLFGFSVADFKDVKSFMEFKDLLSSLARIILKVSKTFSNIHAVLQFKTFADADASTLSDFLAKYKALKNPLFGYLFKGQKIEALNDMFSQAFPGSTFSRPHQDLDNLEAALSIFNFIASLKADLPTYFGSGIDYLRIPANSDTRSGHFGHLRNFATPRPRFNHIVSEMTPVFS